MHRSELFHVGIVVADLEAARDRLGRLLDVDWGAVVSLDAIDVQDGNGRSLTVPNRLCYSTQPPYLELIEEVPGSVWTLSEDSNIHHIGFFTPDLAAESAGLGSAGCPLLLCGRSGSAAPTTFAYHRDPLGVIVELVDLGVRPMIEQLAGS